MERNKEDLLIFLRGEAAQLEVRYAALRNLVHSSMALRFKLSMDTLTEYTSLPSQMTVLRERISAARAFEESQTVVAAGQVVIDTGLVEGPIRVSELSAVLGKGHGQWYEIWEARFVSVLDGLLAGSELHPLEADAVRMYWEELLQVDRDGTYRACSEILAEIRSMEQ